MAETLGPADELDAVNAMLAAVKVAPVSNLASLPPDALTALQTLRRVSRDLQEEGWSFNTDTEFDLIRENDGTIKVPADCLRVDAADVEVVERDRKLWDVENKTFIFTKDVTAELVRHFPWASLPSVARRWITALAIQQFVMSRNRALTAEQRDAFLRAKVAFDNAEGSNGDLNILTGSLTISSMLRRGG